MRGAVLRVGVRWRAQPLLSVICGTSSGVGDRIAGLPGAWSRITASGIIGPHARVAAAMAGAPQEPPVPLADRRGGAGAYRLPEHAVRVVGLRASGGC